MHRMLDGAFHEGMLAMPYRYCAACIPKRHSERQRLHCNTSKQRQLSTAAMPACGRLWPSCLPLMTPQVDS